MTVSLASIAATAESATSVAADYPASIAANDLLLYFVGSKNNTSSHGVPSGFTLLDNDTAGIGSESTGDTGSVVASVFDKDATGSESGTEACAITSGSVAQGFIARLTRSGGTGFDVVTTTARWTTNNTNPIGVTFDDAIDFAVDDVVLVFVGLNANTHTNVASPSFSATGITFGSATAQRFTSTSLGTDMSVSLHSAVVTAGSGSATPSFQATKSTNSAGEGPLILVRIRETAGGGTTPVSSDRSLAWTQRSGVQAGQSLAYPVKNAVQQSRALEWAVRQSVDQTLPLTYTLRSGVQSGLPLAYTISASILRQLDLAWSVLNSGTVVSTLPLTWLVRADVQADRPLAWILRSGVQQPHAMAWEILNSGTVVSSLPLAWLMRSGIQQALPIAYPVRNAVLANRAFAYPVLTAAQSNLLIDYLVRAGVQVSFPLTYEVAGTVQNQLPLAWVVFSSRGVPELLCVNVTNAFPDLRVAVKNVTTLGSDC